MSFSIDDLRLDEVYSSYSKCASVLLSSSGSKDNDDITVVNEISLDDIIELVKKILRDKCLRTDPRNDLESKDNLL